MLRVIPRPSSYVRPYMHAAGRLKQRFDLHMELPEYVALCQQLADTDPHTLLLAARYTSGRRLAVPWQIAGRDMLLMYDPDHGVIVTIMEHGITKGTSVPGETKWKQRQQRKAKAYRRPKSRKWTQKWTD